MTQRFSVLVVDDDRALLDGVDAILSDHFDVVTSTAPMDALRLFDARNFHVVCADYKMPLMNGLEFLHRVSARPVFMSCLLITGGDEYFQKQDKSGFYVLLKPFSPERLVALVQQLARVADMKRTVNTLNDSPSSRMRVFR
jgi:DNA-binding NtrC family response regulator